MAAEIAHHRHPGMHPDAGDAQGHASGMLLLAVFLAERVHLQHAAHRLGLVIAQVQRRIEDGEHRIADELVDHAAMLHTRLVMPSR